MKKRQIIIVLRVININTFSRRSLIKIVAGMYEEDEIYDGPEEEQRQNTMNIQNE